MGKKKPLRKTPVTSIFWMPPFRGGALLSDSLELSRPMKLTLASMLPSCQAKKKPLGGGFKVGHTTGGEQPSLYRSYPDVATGILFV